MRAEESRLWRDEIKKRWTSPPEEFNLIEKKETPEEGNAYALTKHSYELRIGISPRKDFVYTIFVLKSKIKNSLTL